MSLELQINWVSKNTAWKASTLRLLLSTKEQKASSKIMILMLSLRTLFKNFNEYNKRLPESKQSSECSVKNTFPFLQFKISLNVLEIHFHFPFDESEVFENSPFHIWSNILQAFFLLFLKKKTRANNIKSWQNALLLPCSILAAQLVN